MDIKIPFDFISDELNGVTRDIHDQIPDLVTNFIRDIKSRHYTSFSQAAAENAASRIFLGIHFRFDATEGISAGDRIADIDFDSILRPLHGNHPAHVPSVNFAAQIDAYLNNTYTGFFSSTSGGQDETHASHLSSAASGTVNTQLAHALLATPSNAVPTPARPGALAVRSVSHAFHVPFARRQFDGNVSVATSKLFGAAHHHAAHDAAWGQLATELPGLLSQAL